MRYPPSVLDEIRSRLPISRVVERRVKLRRAGREYMGLSPFKTERTPSFTVNDQKAFYHCFASGEHGDIFSFVMKTAGLSFAEAVEQLAAEAGVALPKAQSPDEAAVSRLDRLYAACEAACAYFQAQLWTNSGETARGYLAKRGVTRAEIDSFRLGFAPDNRTALKTSLTAKGITLDEMQEAGLLIHGDDIAVPYDRFRGRLIFPILDVKRRVIAFGGRALLPDQQPKYLNSPETPLFTKGRGLFNIASAREAARLNKTVIVTEGYMDVIALSRAGHLHTVAPLGTALTDDQLRLLWTLSPAPTLCFDGDAAGIKAASRALDVALPSIEPERSLQFVFLPDGKDPDDMIRNGEAGALEVLLSKPQPLFDVLWKRELNAFPSATPEQRAAFDARMKELTDRIVHKTLRYHYVAEIRNRLRAHFKPTTKSRSMDRGQGDDWRTRLDEPNSRKASRQGGQRGGLKFEARSPNTASLLTSAVAQPALPPSVAREELMVRVLMVHSWLFDEHADQVAHLVFEDALSQLVVQALFDLSQEGSAVAIEQLPNHIKKSGGADLAHRFIQLTKQSLAGSFDANADRTVVLTGWLHLLSVHEQQKTLADALHEAETDYMHDQDDHKYAIVCALRQQMQVVIR